MRYSVTGTLDCFSTDHVAIIEQALGCLTHVERFSTGGAFGVDSVAARLAAQLHPRALHELYYPYGEWWNEDLLSDRYWWTKVAVHGGYMVRNDALVAACDVLLAFPKTSEEEQRSGTWATIRRARKAEKPVWMYPLDGSGPWIPREKRKKI